MNETLKINQTKTSFSDKIAKAAIFVMYLFVFIVYCRPGWEIITGPVLALTMFIISMTDYYYIVPITVLFGNSALQNIFMGRIQFMYLVLGLLFVRFFLTRAWKQKISINYFFSFFAIILMMFHLFVFEDKDPTRAIVNTLIYLAIIVYVFNDFRYHKKSFEPLCFHMAFCVFLSALQFEFLNLIGEQGGILYIEGGVSDVDRYGVLGAGVGDPNYSGMYLLLGIFLLLFYCPKIKWYVKAPIIIIELSVLLRTASATSFTMFLVVLLAYFIIIPKFDKKVKLLFGLLLAFLVVFFFAESLFATIINSEEVQRFLEKIQEVLGGNISGATTGRSTLWAQYIDYYISQPTYKILFGGNPVQIPNITFGGVELVSHNSYLDLFIRFGCILAVAIIIFLICRTLHALYIYVKTKVDSEYFLLKIFVLSFVFTISLYADALYVIVLCVVLFMKDTTDADNNQEIDYKNNGDEYYLCKYHKEKGV